MMSPDPEFDPDEMSKRWYLEFDLLAIWRFFKKIFKKEDEDDKQEVR